jgi:hypothetical protein
MGLQKNPFAKKKSKKTWKQLREAFLIKAQRHIRRTREASQRSEPSKQKTDIIKKKKTSRVTTKAKDTSVTPSEDISVTASEDTSVTSSEDTSVTSSEDTSVTSSEPNPTNINMADINNDAAWPVSIPVLRPQLPGCR